MSLPGSWSEVRERLGRVCGGGPTGEAAAGEWIRQALVARWDVQDESELRSGARGVALQKMSGALLALEEEGEIAIAVGSRGVFAAAFARYLGGVMLDGPPWRLDPYEDFPCYDEWLGSADF